MMSILSKRSYKIRWNHLGLELAILAVLFLTCECVLRIFDYCTTSVIESNITLFNCSYQIKF